MMMRVVTSCLAVVCAAAVPASAQFTFPLDVTNYAVDSSADVNVSFNDLANSAGVPSGTYGAFEVTADWTATAGIPWSSEADLSFNTAAGSVFVDPPTSGASSTTNPATIVFADSLAGPYDPDLDGTLSIDLGQSFGTAPSDVTNWTNISVTLLPPPVVSDLGVKILDDGFYNRTVLTDVTGDQHPYDVNPFQVDTTGNYDIQADWFDPNAAGSFDGYLLLFDAPFDGVDDSGAIAFDDDFGGTGASKIESVALTAGTTYYALSTTFSGTAFAGVSNLQAANLVITGPGSAIKIPEPAAGSLLLLSLLGMAMYRRR